MGFQHDPLNPATLALTLLLGSSLLFLPRRWAALPVLVAAIFIPPDQRVIVATLDFNMMRVLILFAFVRLLQRGELRSVRLSSLDGLVIALMLTMIFTATVREGTLAQFVARLGKTFDSFGLYFYMRASLRSWEDLRTTVVGAVVCLGVFAIFMGIEYGTGRNLFSAMGGVPEYTVVREGKLRCQGAFSHPIMAGVFGASWAPLVASLWWRNQRATACAGVVFCGLISWFSSSSTPLACMLVGLFGLALWPVRQYLPFVRWGTFALLVVLHFAREQPIWHLLSRVRFIGGSTGWHRFWIVDRAIEHFDEWWLIGNRQIDHWGIHANDITNYYVATGLDGGFIATILLIALLWAAFHSVGRALRAKGLGRWERRLIWALGATLTAHAVTFMASKYFGQMDYIWYLQLAMTGSSAQLARRQQKSRAPARRLPTIERELRPRLT